MSNNKYTPASLDKSFIVPLYQRLFEWDEAQVLQLLNDLYSSFIKDATSPYYIGMLTVYKGNSSTKYSLVDGQQRFTVLNLIAIAFGWKDFLMNKDGVRLSFFGRKKDQDYLKSKIEGQDLKYVNVKMETALSCITNFIKDKIDDEGFEKYIKTQTNFFLSELPSDYTIQDLNRYFEAMNQAGKGLENHEILKVQLLRKSKEINGSNEERYTKIWNVISEMDKCLVRQQEGELQKNYRNRLIKALQEDEVSLATIESDIAEDNSSNLFEIKASSIKPNEIDYERDEKAILTFSEFLLQVLWLCVPKDERVNATNFFNKSKLLETFNHFLVKEKGLVNIDDFFNSLLRYRMLFDYFIIRLNSSDNRNTNYSLNMINNTDVPNLKRCVIQYQAMLYVSSQNHIWLTPIFEKLNKNIEISLEEFLNNLKRWDNNRYKNHNSLPLNYGSINRYWFWRLDYYLWEKRETYFKDEISKKTASNYIFRTNRSVEHIAPQTPKRESNVKLDEDYLHSFGNLVMISAGQNSSLQNESFEVKRAHIDSFITGSVGGSVESLKMLNLHNFNTWNRDYLKEHQNNMLDILIDSFKDGPNEVLANYENIIKILEENKYNHA